MKIADKQAQMRAMLAEMEMNYGEAAKLVGVNPNCLGYILSTAKFNEVFSRIEKLYKERQS